MRAAAPERSTAQQHRYWRAATRNVLSRGASRAGTGHRRTTTSTSASRRAYPGTRTRARCRDPSPARFVHELKPERMSVTPAAIQIRVFGGITSDSLANTVRRTPATHRGYEYVVCRPRSRFHSLAASPGSPTRPAFAAEREVGCPSQADRPHQPVAARCLVPTVQVAYRVSFFATARPYWRSSRAHALPRQSSDSDRSLRQQPLPETPSCSSSIPVVFHAPLASSI